MRTTTLLLFAAPVILAGCAAPEPKHQMTPLEIQSMQTREFEAPKKTVFASVVSVFQDLGYTITNADIETGLIAAKSATQDNRSLTFWTGYTQMRQNQATGFVETIGARARVRLNFVATDRRQSIYGRENQKDTPILDAQLYQNAFERIENAIFVRSAGG